LVCESIERLLLAATGRPVHGDITDVLLRVVRSCEYGSVVEPDHGRHPDDWEKLAYALWCVLCKEDEYGPLGFGVTLPGISGETSRFEFARQYCEKRAVETPGPDFWNGGTAPTTAQVQKWFEEFLVCCLASYQVNATEGEFSLLFKVVKIRKFCLSLYRPMGDVCERFLRAIAVLEEAGSLFDSFGESVTVLAGET